MNCFWSHAVDCEIYKSCLRVNVGQQNVGKVEKHAVKPRYNGFLGIKKSYLLSAEF